MPRDHALLLECERDFTDSNGTKRVAGDQWLEFGPKHYIPDVHVQIIRHVEPEVIVSGTALKVEANRACKDSKGVQRQAGEQWLVRDLGFYIPQVDENVIGLIEHAVTEENIALHLRATKNFKDIYGKDRKAGEEWLVTTDVASSHILDVAEELVAIVEGTQLEENQYCYIENPFNSEAGRNEFGKVVKIEGPCCFFLKPHELLVSTKDAYILKEDQALLLRAEEDF